ncbi:endonuclease [Ichthyenterobacterium sp. W332]|uniref:Endonuclease n=1 Tax=Microcosmobacter mediterraneus TaxID=3075607 RepID=A0ABU2YGK0_9FLAO|nr:endonuclease [Ichthyenterobacterium sp. W332]MDT0557299.1 endonuclease [Ichthyenterobacterium sp. W332]
MKHIYIFFILISTIVYAQVPANYYNSANGLSGFTLKTELRDIITNGHVDQGYSALYTGYETTHSDNIAETGYENNNSVLLFYTENPNGADSYQYFHGSNQCGNYNQEGICHNREHIVPQSAFNSASPMQNDIHHVIPSDGFVNGARGSVPFGIVATADYTSDNGSKRGSSGVPGYSGTVFEPIDEFKGDIARAILYFAVRYQNNVDTYGFEMFNGTEDQVFETWAIDMLLDWHYNIDPVDNREIIRNNAAYNYQGNANPFVNHPEYANLIWNPNPDTEAPSDPTNLVASNPSDTSIDLNWTASTDNIAVTSYDVYADGVNSFNTTNTSFTVTGLVANTNYCFRITAKDAANNVSGLSNEDCETTTDNGSGAECANETFEAIPANNGSYTDRMWTGDNGLTWNATEARTDQDINGSRALTLDMRGSSEAVLTSPSISGGIGDLTLTTQRKFSGGTGDLSIYVNGNLVGTIAYDDTVQNSSLPNINVEGDIVLVITEDTPDGDRVAIDDLSWTCYTELSIEENSLETVKLYPNPVTNNSFTVETTQNLNLEIYDVLGKIVFSKTVGANTSTIDISNLNSGIYLIKLNSGGRSFTKKLIKQ